MATNNIRRVDAIHNGQAYMLEAGSKAVGTKVGRADRKLKCNDRGCGGNIARNEYFLYMRGEGRMCCRCAVILGALEPFDVEDQP